MRIIVVVNLYILYIPIPIIFAFFLQLESTLTFPWLTIIVLPYQYKKVDDGYETNFVVSYKFILCPFMIPYQKDSQYLVL